MTGPDQGSAPRHVKLTYDDYVRFPDDGMRHELIDGEHFVTPSPNTRHQRISHRLTMGIGSWLNDHPVGELFAAPFDVVFSPVDVVEPDLVYVSHQRAPAWLAEKHARGADLVIEIGSPGTRVRDETSKRQLYERAGVAEYWFVDPDRNLIRVFRRAGERLEAVIEPSSARDEELTTPLLPGFRMSLRTLFRD